MRMWAVLFAMATGCIGYQSKIARETGCSKSKLEVEAEQDGQVATCESPEGKFDCGFSERDWYCVPYKPQEFKAEEYSAWSAAGSATISGDAFSKTRAGDVKVAAGETVWLVPATAYFRDFAVAVALGITRPIPATGLYQQTTADGQGKWKFENVSEGEWFIVSSVSWALVDKSGVVTTTTRSGLVATVGVKAGERKENIVLKAYPLSQVEQISDLTITQSQPTTMSSPE